MYAAWAAVGLGFLAAGLATLRSYMTTRKLAAAGDERAKAKLAKRRIIDVVVASVLTVAGVCLVLFDFYLKRQSSH